MNTQSDSMKDQPIAKRPRGLRFMIGVDALLLGILPMICAVIVFLGNLRIVDFGMYFLWMGWYTPLEWYIQNGRLIYSDFDFFIGHGFASLLPGILLLISASWAWFGKTASRNVFLLLIIVTNLLAAIAILTIRNFGPFLSSEHISRWLFAGFMIVLNVWYFLRPTTRTYYQR